MAAQIDEFAAAVKSLLHPRPYQYVVQAPADVSLLLFQNWMYLARYALVVVPWDSQRDGAAQLRLVRQQVARACGAVSVIREVGLYAIFCGPCKSWSTHVDAMPADRTGLHRVIVQAVHLIDLEVRVQRINQARWNLEELTGEQDTTHIEIRFGGVDQVAPLISALVRREPAPDFRAVV